MFRFKSWGTSSSNSNNNNNNNNSNTISSPKAESKSLPSVIGNDATTESVELEMNGDRIGLEKNEEESLNVQATLKRERTISQERIDIDIEQIRKTSSYSSSTAGSIRLDNNDESSPMIINYSQRPMRMSSLSTSFVSFNNEDLRNDNASISSASINGDLSKLPSLASMNDLLTTPFGNTYSSSSSTFSGRGFSTCGVKDSFHARTESASSLSSFSLLVDTPPTPLLFAFGTNIRAQTSNNNNVNPANVPQTKNPMFSDVPFQMSSSSSAAAACNDDINGLPFQSSNAFTSTRPPTIQPSSPQQQSGNDLKPKTKNKYVSLFLRPPLFFRSSKSRHTTDTPTPTSTASTDPDLSKQNMSQVQELKDPQFLEPSALNIAETPNSLQSNSASSSYYSLRRKSSTSSNKSPRLGNFEPNLLPVQSSLENLEIEDNDSRKRRKQSNPTPVQVQFGNVNIESGSIAGHIRKLRAHDPSITADFANQMVENDDHLIDLFHQAIAAHKNEAFYLLQSRKFLSLDKACYIAAKFNNIEFMKELINKRANINSCAPGSSGVTPLLIAAHHGHEEMVRMLCEAGADITAEKENGSNVMFSTCKHGHLSILKILHLYGATFAHGFRRLDGMHAIHVACERGHRQIIEYILDFMNGNISVELPDSRSTCLHLACSNGHIEAVKALIARGANIDARDNQGFTPLSICIQNGNLLLLRVLLNSPNLIPTDSSNALDLDSNTASTSSHEEKKFFNTVSQVFLSHFDEFFCTSQIDDQQLQQLYNEEISIPPWISSRSEQIDLISKRIKQKTKDGNNLLAAACRIGKSIPMIMYLTRVVLNPKELLDGLTPLLYLSKCGKSEILLHYLGQKQKICGKWDSDILLSEKSENGWTALHWASRGGHVNALDVLISFLRECARFQLRDTVIVTPTSPRRQANESMLLSNALQKLVDTELDNGMTPLYIASHHGHLNAVKMLVDFGNADITKGLADGTVNGDSNQHLRRDQDNENQNGINRINSPLFTAVKHGHVGILQYFSEKLDRNLLMRRVRGMNIVHVACLHQQLNVLKYLIETLGVDPSSHIECDFNGWLPIHISARVGSLNIIKYLLEVDKRTPIDVALHSGNTTAFNQNEQGFTALHVAISNGRINVVKYLVRAGANLGLHVRVGNMQRSIQDLARLINRPRIAEWLEKASSWNELELACDFCDVEKFVELARSDHAQDFFKKSLIKDEDTVPLHLRLGKISLNQSFEELSANKFNFNCSCESDFHEIYDTVINMERGQLSRIKNCRAISDYFNSSDVDTIESLQNSQFLQTPICKKMVLVIQRCMSPWTIANHFLYPRMAREAAMSMHIINRRSHLALQMLNSMEVENQVVEQTQKIKILPYLPQEVLEIILSFIGRS